MAQNGRLSFIAEWFHVEAGITRSYLLTYYLSDNAVELVSALFFIALQFR